ncbi:PAS domain S-box protein [Dechloromonas denitrificans]|uniref:PAS domain S-box protein n=1 Tax=Dechloromonas denitrificans TaxID=281362 RepID=UPI001CF912DF|nr:PAS domain S-box protein [Dechloromonas denitrificans]UCV12043.1 PAS domain S-box protein [Dechloromonas denitrificans]
MPITDRTPHLNSRNPRFFRWILPSIIFGALVIATWAGWQWQLQVQADNLNETHNQESAAITAEIRERLHLHAHFLRSLQAFASTTPGQDLKNWRRYTQEINLGSNLSGLFAFAYAPAVRPAELERFVSDTRRQVDRSDFNIFPAIDGDVLTPVTFIAPDNNTLRSSIGFNLLSETTRRQAIENAITRRDVAMSGPIVLLFDKGSRRPGFLLVHTLYHQGMPLNNVQERQQAFSGLVLTAYRTDEFLSALKKGGNTRFSLQIFDENLSSLQNTASSPTLIYDSDPELKPSPDSPIFHHEIDFGGRNWILSYRPRHDESKQSALNPASLILVGGLIGSSLLALLVFYLTTHRERALRYANQLTGELSTSEERLRLAMAASNDGIWDQNLQTHQDYISPRMAQIFGFSEATAPDSISPYLACIIPEDLALQRSALRRHLKTNAPYDVELRIHKQGGEITWVRVRGEALRNQHGHPIRLAGSVSDITENKQVEVRLERLRGLLSTSVAAIPLPVFVQDERHSLLMVNHACCRLFGCAESELLGRHWPTIGNIPAEDQRLLLSNSERTLSTGRSNPLEFRLSLENGDSRLIVAHTARAQGPEGHPLLISTLTDMTELRRAESAIQAADHLKQSVLDAATEIAIIATDPQGVITVFNRGAEKMLGYTAAEMVGRLTPAVIHQEVEVTARAEELSHQFRREISGFATFTTLPQINGAEQREWTYIRKDGACLTVSLVVTAQRGTGGETIGYLGTAIDITEQKRAEHNLRQKHELLQTVLEHIPGGVSMIDAELNFSMANSALKTVLDFPDELFAGKTPTLHEVALFNARRGEYGPGDPELIAAEIVAKARNPEPHCFERTRPNGKTIEVRGAPLPDGGFVTIYTDITKRRQTDEELLQHRNHLQELVTERTARLAEALHQAQAASQAKSEFLANMSHELRTPMHAILSFSELGTERAGNGGEAKLLQYFQRIEQSAQRLLGLINELLDLSKLEAGRMELSLEKTEVMQLLQQVEAQLEPLLLAHRQTLTLEGKLPQTEIMADPNRITQVIYNLLSNAIKFSPDGGRIRICLDAAVLATGRRSEDRGVEPAIAIQFIDDGVGVPEEELESIFDKFVQSSTTKNGAGGTGLGLAITRAIVLQHRGTIVATNNVGGGACFTVTLPLNNGTVKVESHE